MNKPSEYPERQAMQDFANGCSMDENPYPQHSHEHSEWQLAMERYINRERLYEAQIRHSSGLQ